jgi:WD40 repeat protein
MEEVSLRTATPPRCLPPQGHISGLTGGQWHPIDRFTAITASEDGTVRAGSGRRVQLSHGSHELYLGSLPMQVRVWDTHNLLQKTVVKPSLARPVRTAVTAVAYNSSGSFIGAGLADGTIQIWGVGGEAARPARLHWGGSA